MIDIQTPLPAPCEVTRAGDQTPGLADPATAGPLSGPATRAPEAGGTEAPASGAWSTQNVITCKCCGKPGARGAHGWRNSCYRRWLAHDRPEDGPPPPRANKAYRIGEYVELTDELGLSPEEARDQLRICERTRLRYQAALRNAAAPTAPTTGSQITQETPC